MNADFLNCRICGSFVRTKDEIFCFNCDNCAHRTCLPVPITKAEFRDRASQDFLQFCTGCSSKIQDEMRLRIELKQAQLLTTYYNSNTLTPFSLPNERSLQARHTSRNNLILKINNSTQTDLESVSTSNDLPVARGTVTLLNNGEQASVNLESDQDDFP